MARTNVYKYFCPIARALELVGEKWTLPIVLALLLEGPLRFSDLERELETVTAKTLTGRLRELEAAGLVERERLGSETRYTLTQAGQDLGPVLSALNRWSVEHEVRPPEDDEFVRPSRIERSLWAYLVARRAGVSSAHAWELHLGEADVITFAYAEGRWHQPPGPAPEPSLTVRAPLAAWSRFLAAGPGQRTGLVATLSFEGAHAEREAFLSLFDVHRAPTEELTASAPSATVAG